MSTTPLLAEIIGPDILIILVIVALLFGSRLPKLARSLGSAKSEFEKGIAEGNSGASAAPAIPPVESVTLTRGELDAIIAERDAKGSAATGPTSTSPSPDAPGR